MVDKNERRRRVRNAPGANNESGSPLAGGFGKVLIAAVILIILTLSLSVVAPWTTTGQRLFEWRGRPGTPDGEAAAAAVRTTMPSGEGRGVMTTLDGRVIRMNVGLPESDVVIERDGREVARFRAELANSPEAQQIGLMGRTYLAPDRAMLFTWDPPESVSMWMKDTLIPLDMLYVRADGVIVAIGHNVPPCSPETSRCPTYPAPEPVRHVLEIAGGRARELGLRPGDRLVVDADGR